ncbi:PREDICTED: uncharacterized protein LOC104801138 [Tarenaya hassleriana]|uniref:uncharacterized protein LOC104801138 n=1 Tax=Tarenaya hassleriana TaxID=28532 RepID=UPI00053C4D20|nr:PREDICTED: uncharacterized protein LOC104801138 [Tarenaya hassleriana]
MENTDSQISSPQILGIWDFHPLDPTTIVMVSPPSSPEPVFPAEDDDSFPESVAMETGNEPCSAELDGISLLERATGSKSPPSAIGKARVSDKERAGPLGCPQKGEASSENVRLTSGKQPAVSESPSSSARGEARVPGNLPTSTGNVGVSAVKEPNTAEADRPRRILPPTIAASEEWGGGKWKEDWRTKRRKIDEKADSTFLKEVIEALARNSGEAEEDEENMESFSYVEILQSMGIKFPQ